MEKQLKKEVQEMKKFSNLLSAEFFSKFEGLNQKLVNAIADDKLDSAWAKELHLYITAIKDMYSNVAHELSYVSSGSSFLGSNLLDLKITASEKSRNFNVMGAIMLINNDNIYSKK